MKVFVDESADDSRERTLIVGGWSFSNDNAERFSEEWRATLANEPAIAYFKHNETKGLKGQFHGFTAETRDRKLEALAEVICRRATSGIVSILPHRLFEHLLAGMVVPRRQVRKMLPHIDAYALSFHNVIASYVQTFAEAEISEITDFIFDDGQGALRKSIEMYEIVRAMLPDSMRAFAGEVSIADDRETPGLQAADLLVGQIAKNARTGQPEPLLQRLARCTQIAYHKIEPRHLTGFAATLKQFNIVWSTHRLEDASRRHR